MAFLFAVIVLDVVQVFGLVLVILANLNDIDPSGWMALLAGFMTFIILESLGLGLTHISRQELLKLSFVFVFVSMLVFPTGFVFLFFD